MKKTIILIAIMLLTLSVNAQEDSVYLEDIAKPVTHTKNPIPSSEWEHVKFMGIQLNGSIDQFTRN